MKPLYTKFRKGQQLLTSRKHKTFTDITTLRAFERHLVIPLLVFLDVEELDLADIELGRIAIVVRALAPHHTIVVHQFTPSAALVSLVSFAQRFHIIIATVIAAARSEPENFSTYAIISSNDSGVWNNPIGFSFISLLLH
jgi:hypothetical protein